MKDVKYRLMAVDIDGTLVDSDGRITRETIEAIRLGVSKGLIFSICTGRPIQGVEELNEKIGLDLPFITYNGAMVVMGKSREILYERSLSAKDAKEIIELGIKYGTTIIIWSQNRLYTLEKSDRVFKYKEAARVEPILISRDQIDEVVQKGVTKVLWFDEPELVEKYQGEVGRHLSGNVNFHTSRPIYLEFVDKKASKAIAMEKLGEHFGISRSEMIAVGDGYNDISMLDYAGLGVAMANAKDDIKKHADYITLSNDENGVAHVIYKFITK